MIRANLLPRPKHRVGIAGIDIDTEYLRGLAFAALVVVIVAAIGIAIEMFRVARLEAAAAEQEARIAAQAPQRAELKALALEVARYQSFAHEALAYRRSGPDVAIAVARIGNTVPVAVWLDSLQQQGDGYDIAGSASSLDRIGTAIVSLGHSLPDAHATLVTMESQHRDDSAIHFTAHVGTRVPSQPQSPRSP